MRLEYRLPICGHFSCPCPLLHCCCLPNAGLACPPAPAAAAIRRPDVRRYERCLCARPTSLRHIPRLRGNREARGSSVYLHVTGGAQSREGRSGIRAASCDEPRYRTGWCRALLRATQVLLRLALSPLPSLLSLLLRRKRCSLKLSARFAECASRGRERGRRVSECVTEE